VTAAAVLAFVQAGFLIVSGIVLLAGGAWALQEFDEYALGIGAEITIVSIITLAAAALLITGGAQGFNRKAMLLIIGCAVSLVLSVYWFIRLATAGVPVGPSLVYPLIFAILPVIALALINSGTARAWLASRAKA
jgi:hypothetical protein